MNMPINAPDNESRLSFSILENQLNECQIKNKELQSQLTKAEKALELIQLSGLSSDYCEKLAVKYFAEQK